MYDIAILDEAGAPKNTVSIGVDEHYEIMELAKANNYSILLKMKDYYEDSEIEFNEIIIFEEEINNLLKLRIKNELKIILQSILELINFAKSNKLNLFGISD